LGRDRRFRCACGSRHASRLRQLFHLSPPWRSALAFVRALGRTRCVLIVVAREGSCQTPPPRSRFRADVRFTA
jgi:hypothetical protein